MPLAVHFRRYYLKFGIIINWMGGKVRDINAYARPKHSGDGQGNFRLLQMPERREPQISISEYPAFRSIEVCYPFEGSAERIPLHNGVFDHECLNRIMGNHIRDYLDNSELPGGYVYTRFEIISANAAESAPSFCTVAVSGKIYLNATTHPKTARSPRAS